MTRLDLSKSQKKIARQIIEKGLQIEYAQGISKIEALIAKWKAGELDNRKAYLAIYSALISHDKRIGRRYDRMSGSQYLWIIAGQLANDVITLDDLSQFNEDVREQIIFMSRIDH